MTENTPLRRDRVLGALAKERRPLQTSELAARLGVPSSKYAALQRILDDLSFDGTIVALPGQRFKIARDSEPGGETTGIISVHPRGFGFVSSPRRSQDLFIPAEKMGGALHGDTVVVRVFSRSRRGEEGEVVRIEKRRSERVAGTLRKKGKSAWLEPDDTRIRGPIVLLTKYAKESFNEVDGKSRRHVEGADGEAAVARIVRWPASSDENPEGILEAVLGVAGDPNVEVAKVLVREAIEERHPEEAIREAEAFGNEVDQAALSGREDLTHLPLPTIDPEDARDHDDAVWVVREPDGGYIAWVAIADVSYYVRPGTALDTAALARGNSIYLPDRALPMLPRALSSNLCSLLPDVLRLCMCVEVHFDATGSVRRSRVFEAFMKSRAKLTYGNVAHALELSSIAPRNELAQEMREDLRVAWELSRLLRARRMRRGALDFELPEAKVVLDPESGAPITVQKRTHDPGIAKAYQLIEELMLLANEVCAEFLVERNVFGVFRNHGAPDMAKLERFATLCKELDIVFEAEDAQDPQKLSSFLKKIANHPQKQVLHGLLLRAMKQAYYDVDNIGHFGLASQAYLHFTSPIRRYPDLLVHRAIRRILRHEPLDRSDEGKELLRHAAMVASDSERKAMEVEREVVDLYRALFMRSKLNSIYEATVTAIVATGLFVSVDDPFVDVLVRMEALGPDEYAADDEGLRVVGRRSGERIAIGDRIVIQIEDVAILRRTVYGRRIVMREEAPEKPKVKKSKRTSPKPNKKAKPEKPKREKVKRRVRKR